MDKRTLVRRDSREGRDEHRGCSVHIKKEGTLVSGTSFPQLSKISKRVPGFRGVKEEMVGNSAFVRR